MALIGSAFSLVYPACASESFEALSQGIQGSFLAMGGVTQRIRNDSLSAAVNNLSTDRHFTTNYQSLLNHFHVEPHRINVRSPNENGGQLRSFVLEPFLDFLVPFIAGYFREVIVYFVKFFCKQFLRQILKFEPCLRLIFSKHV